MDIKYDFVNCLSIIKAISPKTNREYKMLVVKRNDKFNSILLNVAEQSGVPTIDLTKKK